MDSSSIPERKVEDFYFKQLKKLQIFDPPETLPLAKTHLVAVSNKFGLCFVGCPTGVKIISTSIIGKLNKEDEKNINAIVSQFPSTIIDIGQPIRHVAISCDNITLSLCYEQGDSIMLRVYDIPTICSQNGSQEVLGEAALATEPGISLVNFLWNPVIPGFFATCFSNGSVVLWEMTDTKISQTGVLPVSTRATAICWSPKGKQIVVGHKDGHLTQYTPTLEAKKETSCPEVLKRPHQVTSICWISAFVFVNVYTTEEEGDVPQCVVVCNQTKTAPKQLINFEDVYFGMNEERKKGFYTTHLHEWNLTISLSCNAYEIAVFGNEVIGKLDHCEEEPVSLTDVSDVVRLTSETSHKWERWTFEDEKGAAMPLNSNDDDTYPMGIAIDLTSTIPIVENEHSYPPAPLLLLLSTEGLLCPFYMVNKNPAVTHDIVKPPEALPPPGQRSKITGPAQAQSKAVSQQGGQPQPSFQTSKPPSTTGVGQPTTQGSFSSSFTLGSNTKNIFSATTVSSGPSQTATRAISNSPFTFPTPSAPSFSSISARTEVPKSSSGMPSSRPFYQTAGPQLNTAGPVTSTTSGVSASGLLTGLAPSTMSSTGPAEKTVSQQPITRPTFANLFSSQQPSTTFGGTLFKPMSTTQGPGLTRESAPLKSTPSADKLFHLNEHQQQQQQQQQQQEQQHQLLQQKQQYLKKQQELLEKQRQTQLEQQQLEQQQLEQQQLEQQQQQQQLRQLQVRKQQELEQIRQQKIEQQAIQQQQQLRQQQQQQRQRSQQSTTQQNLELSVSNCIAEEIQLFNKELNNLGRDVQHIKGICSDFLQSEELEKLRRETSEEAKTCHGLKQVIKEHNNEIQDVKKKLLSSFEILEDGRIRSHRAKDPRYLHLLKTRSLDPMNANKMRIIRELYMHLDKTLSEVNLALDEEWSKENEAQNKLQLPTMDAIYRTLRTHHMVTLEQSAKLEKIAEKMKRKKLLSPTWYKPSASTRGSREDMNDLSSLEGSMKSLDLETLSRSTIKIPDHIPANKSLQLTNMLRKRQTTPIRRTTIVSPETSRAKQIQRRLAAPITELSPPSRQECDVAETPSTKDESGSNPLFSSTPAVTSSSGEQPNEGVSLRQSREASMFQRQNLCTQEKEQQANRQSPGLLRSDITVPPRSTASPPVFDTAESATPRSTDTLFNKGTTQSTATPPLSSTGTGATPHTTWPRALFTTLQSTPTPPLSNNATVGTPKRTDAPTVFSKSADAQPIFSKSTDMLNKGAPPQTAAGPSSFTLPNVVPSTTEASFKISSSFSSLVTKPSNQLPQQTQTQTNPSREMPIASPAALAAISRAEKTLSTEEIKLDPSASIEPRSMVTHGQSGGERQRDIESETLAARTIAEEALKRSQLEAQKSGTKPQSSTEFAIKSTENPKPGPPVVTVKPVSSRDKIPAPNVTVKPVPVPATSLARPPFASTFTNLPNQPLLKPEIPGNAPFPLSSGGSLRFSANLSTSKDKGLAKENVGLQSLSSKLLPFSFASSMKAEKETTLESSLSIGNDSQPKSSPSNTGIEKPQISASPGVSRQLFKEGSNQPAPKDTDDQKVPSAILQMLQASSASSTPATIASSGNVMGLQLGLSKENIPISSQAPASTSNKQEETAASLGFKLVSGKDATSSASSSRAKPFGAIPLNGFSFIQANTVPSNVFRPFASIQTSSGSVTPPSNNTSITSSGISFGSSTSSSDSTFSVAPSVTSSSLAGPSIGWNTSSSSSSTNEELASLGVTSGICSTGVFSGLPKTTTAVSTSTTSVTTPGLLAVTSAGVTAGPFSSTTAFGAPSTQGTTFGLTLTSQSEDKGGTSQGGLFSGTTISQDVAPQGSPFAATVTLKSGNKPGSVFGGTPTTSKEGTSQGTLFGGTTTTSQDGVPHGSPFAATVNTSHSGPKPGSFFGGTSTTSQGGTSQGTSFGVKLSTSQSGGPQGSPFSATVTSQSGPKPGIPFGGTPTTSQEGTSQGTFFRMTTTSESSGPKGSPFSTTVPSQSGPKPGSLFGGTPTTSQGGTSQGTLFGVTATTSESGGGPKGSPFSATVTSQSGPKPGSIFGGTTTSPDGTTQGSLFGSSQSVSAQGSVFGTATTTSQGGPGLFGSSSSTSSAFGQPSFGQPAFGQTIGNTATSVASSFGQSAFSKPQETTSGIGLGFGGFGLGGQPSEQANKNPFIASPASSPSSGSSLFGGSTSSNVFKPSFGNGSPSTFGSQSSGGFGSGSFSRGTGNVATAGFAVGGAVSSGFGAPSSFGSPLTLGSTLSFGTATAAPFGSAPAFGGAPQIGMSTTGGVFGSSTGGGGFGNLSGTSSFGAIARQSNTSSFGDIAQQTQPGLGGFGQQPTGFGGFGSPGGGAGASTGFGGGSSPQSFNQWR